MTRAKRIWGYVFTAAVCLFALLWFVFSLSGIGKAHTELEISQLEDAIRRCAVACYAEEGRYPQDLEYICDKYGIIVGEDFRVEYDIFADNIMPDIRVVAK